MGIAIAESRTHNKLNCPSSTTFDSCTTQDIVSMRQMRLLRAAADAQLKAQQVAGQDALARGAAEQARGDGDPEPSSHPKLGHTNPYHLLTIVTSWKCSEKSCSMQRKGERATRGRHA